MSDRSNETLPEQMTQGRTAVDIIDDNAHKDGSALKKAVEIVKKPFEHGSGGDGGAHGQPEVVAEGGGLGKEGKNGGKTGHVEVSSLAS